MTIHFNRLIRTLVFAAAGLVVALAFRMAFFQARPNQRWTILPA
jgi:hypothetical protein